MVFYIKKGRGRFLGNGHYNTFLEGLKVNFDPNKKNIGGAFDSQ